MHGLREHALAVVDAQDPVGPAIRSIAGMGGGQVAQERLESWCKRVVGGRLTGEDRVAPDGRYRVQMKDAAHGRFGVARNVGMPVLAVDAFGLAVRMDGQDLGMAVGPGNIGMDVQVAEVAAEPLLLLQVDPLVAEEQDLVLCQRRMQILHLPVTERTGQVDAGNLGAYDWRKRFHSDGAVGHH